MAEASSIQLSWPQPDLAVLTFDAPDKGANILSRSVLDELGRHLDQLEKRTDVAGLVIRSAKPGIFIAGESPSLRRRRNDLQRGHQRRANAGVVLVESPELFSFDIDRQAAAKRDQDTMTAGGGQPLP